MTADQLTREYQDRYLKIEFTDGVVARIRLLTVGDCTEHEDCRGITYELISEGSNPVTPSSVFSAERKYIKSFEPIGENLG